MRERNLPAADREVLRSLQIRSLASVALLGLLGGATMILFSVQTREMEASAAVLSLSGRQRMLSQRAALLAAELDRATTGDAASKLRAELLEIGGLIESTHRALASGSLLGLGGGLPAEVHAVYFEPPHRLDQQVRDFVVTLGAAADPRLDPALSSVGLRSLVGIGLEERILPSLEAATGELERYTTGRIERLQWTIHIMAALTLAALWFLGQFVLWPMMQGMRRHLSSLRQGEAEIQMTIENAPIGLATFDGSGKILSANRALCRMLDYERFELVDRDLTDLLHPEDLDRLQGDLDRLFSGEIDHVLIEERFLRQGGEVAYGQLHCGVLRIADGRPDRLIVHLVDRTEQHRARREARQNQERLAHVTRLTTIGEMAAGLAHEINQPLTAIATYAEASRRLVESGGIDSSELRGVLNKISAQAHRAGEVIQRLRLFIKKRHSRDELIDVNQIVGEAVELARADARFRDIPLQLELEPSLPRVVVDAVQIEQVILNLVRNAVDSCLAAECHEPIRIATELAESELVEVSISDRGLGLTEAEQDRLFEAFYSTKDSGLGMGLTISRSIVSSFGGRLWCTADESGGATFRFSLPVAVGEEVRELGPTAATST
ncbi:MAG: ATP-binding protein [Thermoanaerobaculia bacterium]